MAKAKLKIVERKTTVSREAISKAFAEVKAEKGQSSKSADGNTLRPKTNTRKKSVK